MTIEEWANSYVAGLEQELATYDGTKRAERLEDGQWVECTADEIARIHASIVECIRLMKGTTNGD